jgi:hypothetical protein
MVQEISGSRNVAAEEDFLLPFTSVLKRRARTGLPYAIFQKFLF